jgi:hypothetical protein
MSIIYNPTKLLKRIAPAKKIKKLLSGRLTLNKAALSFFSDVPFISKSMVMDSAINAINNYKDRYEKDKITKKEVVEDPALLINRVQSAVINQISTEIKDEYRGEFYIWLPSSADVPDPQHQLNYGKRFQIGKRTGKGAPEGGKIPGERWGCQCGMEILVPEKRLVL